MHKAQLFQKKEQEAKMLKKKARGKVLKSVRRIQFRSFSKKAIKSQRKKMQFTKEQLEEIKYFT